MNNKNIFSTNTLSSGIMFKVIERIKYENRKNILIAFFLNISFSLIELIGGIFTGSIAIISDSIHDFGDAISIGISFILEKISKKKPNNKYTYGYGRYSILGSLITTSILIMGSIIVIYNAVVRIITPVNINYNGMIIFAIFGIIINSLATFFTKEGDSLNQKAVNLHMLEDVLGWVVVFIGAILMRFTDISIIDSLMSIGVAIFILVNAIKNMISIFDVFLEKTPAIISIKDLKKHLMEIKGVKDIHHIHVWSMDGISNFATLHVVTSTDNFEIVKTQVRDELKEHGINHSTIEIDSENSKCFNKICKTEMKVETHHHH